MGVSEDRGQCRVGEVLRNRPDLNLGYGWFRKATPTLRNMQNI